MLRPVTVPFQPIKKAPEGPGFSRTTCRAAYWATSAMRDPTISFEFDMEAFYSRPPFRSSAAFRSRGCQGRGHFDEVQAEASSPLLVLQQIGVSKTHRRPEVHICDVCVGVCNRILDALPETFAGWDAMCEDQLLTSLQPAAATIGATRSVLQAQVETLRQRGVSWALGTSRQAPWERFS